MADHHVVTLREGNTPLLDAPRAAEYGGLSHIRFKHQGFNPTGSFKDNGMTCGVAQAVRLGMQRVACVSTGNTSASMAAYASAAGLRADHLHSARQYLLRQAGAGARIRRAHVPGGGQLRSDPGAGARAGRPAGHLPAEFHQPFPHRRPENHHRRNDGPARLESARLDRAARRQSRQHVGLRQSPARNARSSASSRKMPRLAVIQAEGAAPFYEFMHDGRAQFHAVRDHPETLATAIKIGDPVSWPKALHEFDGHPTVWSRRSASRKSPTPKR